MRASGGDLVQGVRRRIERRAGQHGVHQRPERRRRRTDCDPDRVAQPEARSSQPENLFRGRASKGPRSLCASVPSYVTFSRTV